MSKMTIDEPAEAYYWLHNRINNCIRAYPQRGELYYIIISGMNYKL